MKKTPEEIAQSLIDRQRAAMAKAAPLLARDLAGRRAMDMLEKGDTVSITALVDSFEASMERVGAESAVLERAVIDYLRSIRPK